MATAPLSSPKFRALDSNGVPLASGKLYSYAAGTSTPLATYTTLAGDIPNSNPVILDANGEADVWVTPGVLYKFVLADVDDTVQWTVDNVPSPGSSAGSAGSADPNTLDPGGRLTLTTQTPITVPDVAGASTLFYTPYKHTQVPLWDGSKWTLNGFTELSQAAGDTTKSPAAVVASSVYDLFVWNDSGTPRLSRGPPWASSTARGSGAGTTELQVVGARYTNKWAISNGPLANLGLYVGTVYANSSALFDDTYATRHVWNACNRVERPMRVTDPAGGWTYGLAIARQANANPANQLGFVVGLVTEPVRAEIFSRVISTGTGEVAVSIGLNSTTTPFLLNGGGIQGIDASALSVARALYWSFPPLGRTVLVWLEQGGAVGVATWTSGGVFSKMFGSFMA